MAYAAWNYNEYKMIISALDRQKYICYCFSITQEGRKMLLTITNSVAIVRVIVIVIDDNVILRCAE